MTKRVPGAKVGRPKKPQQLKLRRGRPEVSLRVHPDRYLVARYDVADTWLRTILKSTRVRASAVTTTDAKAVATLRKLAEVLKTADNLRRMARRYKKPDDMKWRRDIAFAVGHTLLGAATGGVPEQGRIDLIMEYAAGGRRSRVGGARSVAADHTQAALTVSRRPVDASGWRGRVDRLGHRHEAIDRNTGGCS